MPLEVDFDGLFRWARYFTPHETTVLDRLAASIFVNSPDPGGRLMALFSAYFDASGSPVDQSFVIVSGYLANFLQWQLMESSWKDIHKQYGVDLPFHAADFMAATTNPQYKSQTNARKDYVALAGDPKKAEDFFHNICLLETTFVSCAITSIVPMDVYNSVSSLLDLRQVVPPYALAARSCIELVRDWEKKFDVPEPVECIFEEGDFEQGKFTDLMVDEGMPIPIYKKKADFAGLQGADHYAWERSFSQKKNALDNPPPPRLPFLMLVGAIPKLHLLSTTAHLINVCHLKKIDPRTGVKHG